MMSELKKTYIRPKSDFYMAPKTAWMRWKEELMWCMNWKFIITNTKWVNTINHAMCEYIGYYNDLDLIRFGCYFVFKILFPFLSHCIIVFFFVIACTFLFFFCNLSRYEMHCKFRQWFEWCFIEFILNT